MTCCILMTLIFYLSLTDLMTCSSLYFDDFDILHIFDFDILQFNSSTNHQPFQPQPPTTTTTTTRPECELLSRARDLLALNSERDVQQVGPSDIFSMFFNIFRMFFCFIFSLLFYFSSMFFDILKCFIIRQNVFFFNIALLHCVQQVRTL